MFTEESLDVFEVILANLYDKGISKHCPFDEQQADGVMCRDLCGSIVPGSVMDEPGSWRQDCPCDRVRDRHDPLTESQLIRIVEMILRQNGREVNISGS